MPSKGKSPKGNNGPGNKMKFGRPKNTGKTVKRLLSYVAKSKGLLAIVVLMVIISAGANIAGTALLTPIVNEISNLLSSGSTDMSTLIGFLLVLLVVYLCGIAAQYGQSRIMLNISQKTLNILRKDLFEHLQKLPWSSTKRCSKSHFSEYLMLRSILPRRKD